MKVTVSVFGRFHAFYLADQLHRRGYLQQLITTYPKFEVSKYNIPSTKVDSIVYPELMARIWARLPVPINPNLNPQFFIHECFDKAAARHIAYDIDLYVGWSSFSERGLSRAKATGAVTIVERCSSHIEYQRDILQEEYGRFGSKPELPQPEIVEKEKREYDLADYVSIPSEFVRRTFLEKGFPAAKLIKVPYGVRLDGFKQIPKEDKTFRVIFAGSMSLRKGVHYLLQAFAELRLPNAELWLVGTKLPEIEPFFKKYAGSFHYIGHVPQAKLHEYYSQCSVFAICSVEEGMAYVQAQAMACRLPLICTTNTGGEDLITDGKEGFVIPIRDVEALKEKILYLYENQDICYEMGQAAMRKVQQGFTWDDYGNKIYAEYQRVLSDKR